MLPYITVLLLCQLAGEVLVRLAGLPLPGPVLGMVILFIGLIVRGRVPDGLDKTVQGIFINFPLLFVPASVGVMVHFKVIAAEALPIAAGVLISSVLTLVISGRLMQFLMRRKHGEAHEQ